MAAALSLDVTDSAGATPRFDFTRALSAGGIFEFGVGGELSGTHARTLYSNMQFSVAETLKALANSDSYLDCPKATSDLAGDLNLQEIVSANMPLYLINRSDVGSDGQFGTTITFTLTENLSGVGPNWIMSEGSGPGKFGSVGRVHTNKLSIAFVEGPERGKIPGLEYRDSAQRLLGQIQANDIVNSLNKIANQP